MTKESLAIQRGLAKSKIKKRLYVLRQNRTENKIVNNNIHLQQIEQHSSVFQHDNQNFDCEMIDGGETCKNEIEDDDCYFEESIEDLQYTENIFLVQYILMRIILKMEFHPS